MELTKLEHSAIVLREGDASLVIDPGSFTPVVPVAGRLDAIVITHEHADHWTPAHLDALLAEHGGTPVFGPAGVVAAASGYDVTVVAPGDEVAVGAFTLRFFGGRHAVIHSSIPVVDNVGVLVNDVLYDGGDSYAVPEGVDVDVLAAPAGAPWAKIGEIMDYVAAVAPRRCFTVHEAVLSEAGLAIANERVRAVTEAGGGTFLPLRPGDSTTI